MILDEPELHLVEQDLVPDLAGWRRARMPELPDVGVFRAGARLGLRGPLARHREARPRAEDAPLPAAGVRHVWLVDPVATTLEIYRLDGEGWRLVQTHAGEVTIRAEPFDAVELDLGSLWSR